MRFNHATLIAFSGLIWLAIGFFLLSKGLQLIVVASQAALIKPTGTLGKLTSLTGGVEQAALLLIAIGLLVGFLKGRFVLVKSVKKIVARIVSFPSPVAITKIYNSRYYILIGAMMALGISLKWMHLPNDLRGGIDVAIGAALINGALIYFRYALAARKKQPVDSSHE